MTVSYYNSANELTGTTDPLGNTTIYAYTSDVSGIPNGLQYCSVDPVDYQGDVSCPAYGASHVSGTTTSTFDSAGDVLTITNGDGDTTTNVYDVSGHPGLVSSTTDPDGTTTSYAYDDSGQVTSQVAAFNDYSATTAYAYDASGRKYCEVDPLEYSLDVRCPTSPPSSSSTPSGVTSTFYDPNGHVIQTTNAIGGTTQSAYDGDGNLYCTLDPAAFAEDDSCPSSPPTGDLIPTADSDSYLGMTIDTYNSLDQLVQESNPLGGITLYTYDQNGNKVSQEVESNDSTNDPSVTTDYAYDGDNQLLSTTIDPGGSLSATTLQSYDPDGNVYCSVSANAYAEGSSSYQCPPWQSSWIASTPSPSDLYSSTPDSSQANNVTTTFYDANGNQLQSINPDVETTLTAYDPDSRAYCTIDPVNVAADASCASVGATPNAGTQTTTYDAAGNPRSTTDQNGNTTSYTYDSDGNKTSVTNPDDKTTTYCYYWEDASGQCAHAAPSSGGAGSMLYSTTTPDTAADPDGETTTTTYEPGGATYQITSLAGTTTDSYDANGDITSTDYSGTASGFSTTPDVTTSYNPDGTRQEMTDGSGTTDYTYDDAGDVTEQASTAGEDTGLSDQTVDFGYFSTGDLQSITYPSYGDTSDPQATYTYDATGQMASVTDWEGNTVSFSHDADGYETEQANVSSSENPNGTSNMALTYDAADQQTDMLVSGDTGSSDEDARGVHRSITLGFLGSLGDSDSFGSTSSDDGSHDAISSPDLGGGGPCDSPIDFPGFEVATGSTDGGSRNPDGQVTSLTNVITDGCHANVADEVMAYDPAGRLTYQNYGDTVPSEPTGNSDYGYDAAGNPTTISEPGGSDETQTFDDAGEVLTSDQTDDLAYTHDSLGDRTNVTDETEDSDLGDYGYDQTGQMVSSAVSGTTTDYLYNGDGLECGATSGSSTQQFVWATLNSEPLLLSDGINAYIYGPGTTPVEDVDMSSSTPTFVNFNQTDGLSTYAMGDASGDATQILEYNADGAQQEADFGAGNSGFGYAGQYLDAATGLYDMRARWYDAGTNVFTSVDPALSTTNEPYEYANNDPVNNTDPTGLCSIPNGNPNSPFTYVRGPCTEAEAAVIYTQANAINQGTSIYAGEQAPSLNQSTWTSAVESFDPLYGAFAGYSSCRNGGYSMYTCANMNFNPAYGILQRAGRYRRLVKRVRLGMAGS